MQHASAPNLDRLLRPREVAKLLGVSMSTLWGWARRGHLPLPLAVGPNATAWRASDIQGFIDGLPSKGNIAPKTVRQEP